MAGALGDRAACIAEAWVGAQGLLDRLETELGIGRVLPRAAERTAQLAHDLRDQDGYWRASYDVDPLATARRLLSDRDALWVWGWRGQPVSDRLSGLARATASALPGLAPFGKEWRRGTSMRTERPRIGVVFAAPPDSTKRERP